MFLILEDRPEDADLALHELRRAGYKLNWRRVDDEPGFRANLDPELDLILADYHQPQFKVEGWMRSWSDRSAILKAA